MRFRTRLLVIGATSGVAMAASTGPVLAGGFNFNAHLFQGCFQTGSTKCNPQQGEAENVNDTAETGALLTSFGNTSNGTFGFAGVRFDVPGSNFTFADLTTLQTDYEVSRGNCGLGAPRWQIALRTPSGAVHNLQVYLGPASSLNGDPCNEAVGTEVNTGNYIGVGGCGDTDVAGRYDDSQFGGSGRITYSMAASMYGADEVVGLSLAVDGGYGQPQDEQQVFLDVVQVGGTVKGVTSTTTSYPDTTASSGDSESSMAPPCN